MDHEQKKQEIKALAAEFDKFLGSRDVHTHLNVNYTDGALRLQQLRDRMLGLQTAGMITLLETLQHMAEVLDAPAEPQLEKLELRNGDILVVHIPSGTGAEETKLINNYCREMLVEHGLSGVSVVLAKPGMSFSVLSTGEDADGDV